MYPSMPKNTYGLRNRSDLQYFYGGYTVNSILNESDLDLPNAIYLTKGNLAEKKFSIRVDLPSKFIEISLSMAQLNEWFAEIKKEHDLSLEDERDEMDETEVERADLKAERDEREAERNQAIDMGEYDIGQEKGELNWMNNCENTGYDENKEKCTPVVCTLTPSTYDHAGECVPSKEKCQYCYKYWCGKCGCGVSNYLSKCCW